MNANAEQRKPGEYAEIGRYQLPEESRRLVGTRIDGVIHIYDWPFAGGGRCYFVEKHFGSKVELAFLLADYRHQAERYGACPMSREAIDRSFAARPALT